jgi:hypothetical protein
MVSQRARPLTRFCRKIDGLCLLSPHPEADQLVVADDVIGPQSVDSGFIDAAMNDDRHETLAAPAHGQ